MHILCLLFATLLSAAHAGAPLPVSFEANRGQFPAEVRFASHAGNADLWLLADRAVMSFRSGRAVTLRWRRARYSGLTGLGPIATKTHYPAQNITGAPHYTRVWQAAVYPGIDVVYHASETRLEFDLVVAPGGDARRPRLDVTGADSLGIDGDGTLVIAAGRDRIRLGRPDASQNSKPVRGRFELRSENSVGFAVGPYDRSQPLLIDPTITYEAEIGGNSLDVIYGAAVDPAGALYLTGQTYSPNFPFPPGTQRSGATAIFVIKVNRTRTAIVYTAYLGAGSGNGIAADLFGNAYVTGYVSSGFPASSGAFQRTSGGGLTDAFVAKLSSTGTIVYATYLGGSLTDSGSRIVLDAATNAYIAGVTGSSNFPVSSGAARPQYGGGPTDAFVTKLNPDGNGLVYSTYLGGSLQDSALGIDVDPTGAAYVAGLTESTNFPVTAGSFQATKRATGGGVFAALTAFVTRLTPAGAIDKSTYLGGNRYDFARAAAVDPDGNVHITGGTQSTDFPVTPGAVKSTNCCGSQHVFVTVLNPALSALIGSTYFGGTGQTLDYGAQIRIDAAGNSYVFGPVGGDTFPAAQTAALRRDPNDITNHGLLLGLPSDAKVPLFTVDTGANTTPWDGAIYTGVSGRFFEICSAGEAAKPLPDGSVAKVSCRTVDAPPRQPLLKLNNYLLDSGGDATVGLTVRFRVIVQNIGAEDAVNVEIVNLSGPDEAVEPSTNEPSISDGAGFVCALNAQQKTWKCTTARFPPGAFVRIDFEYRLKQLGSALNIANTRADNSLASSHNFGFEVARAPTVCPGSLSSRGTSIPAGGGSIVINVQAQSGCTWDAQASDLFLTTSMPPRDPAPPPTQLKITASSNPTTSARSGTVLIGAQTFTVTQAAQNCDFTLSSQSASMAAAGGDFTVTVNTAAGCAWKPAADPAFVSLTTNGTGASGTGVLGYTVAVNNASSPRIASIKVAGQTLQIVQHGYEPPELFTDVPPTHPYFDYITLMGTRLITSGCTVSTYCPDATTSRGQMAVFIIRALLGGDDFAFTAQPFFTDVPASHPYFKWIQKMKDLGITSGCSADSYCPNDAVTRGQMAAFIIRARLRASAGNTFPFPAAASFTDVTGSHPFFSFIQKMKEQGITSGCTASQYCPDDNVTRGQMAVFLIRLLAP